MAANQGREEIIDVTFAVTDEGVLLGAKVFFWEDIGAYPASAGSTAGMAGAVFPGPYKFPVVLPGGSSVYTNTVGKAAYRGPWMMETVAREQMMDHIAYELGIDPIEIRRRNVIHADDLPYTTCTTMVYESVTPSETLEQALEMLDVAAFRTMQADARAEGRLLGMGVAIYIEPSAVAFGILSSDQAIMRMDNSGKVIVAMSTGNHGQSLETTIPQIVAEHLGCNIEDVLLVQGNTESSPTGPGTGGSRSAVVAGGAAMNAALKMKDKIVQIAAHMLEASPDDMEVNAGVVSVKGTPAKALPFAMIAPIAYQMLPACRSVHVVERHARVHGGDRPRDGDDQDPALHRLGGLRPDGEPDGGRRSDRWWRGAGDRRCAVREHDLRRGWQPVGHHVPRLPDPDGSGSARYRGRSHRDARAWADRLQGDG
jgi:carbon-monoxide dehydrogenase large subunit